MADGEQPPSSHPQVAFFHVFFKGAALVFYILGSWFTSNFVIDFVVTVLLLALDFWVVKNVSGRLLAGLRWWNETDEMGETHWHFESLDQAGQELLNPRDVRLFWWSLYLAPVLWIALAIIALLKLSFDYLLINIVAVVLSGANLYGYTKCQSDAQKQIQQFAQRAITQHLVSSVTSIAV